MLTVKRTPRIQLSILQQISCNSLSFLEPQPTNYHAIHKPQCICFCFVFLQRIERQIFHRRNSWHLTFGSKYDLLFHQTNSDVELPQQHVNYLKKLQHDCLKIMCSLLIRVYEVLYTKRVTLQQFIFLSCTFLLPCKHRNKCFLSHLNKKKTKNKCIPLAMNLAQNTPSP